MTDRIEEIERRIRAAMDVKYPCGEGASGPELSIFYAHCYGDDGDVSFLLGEVRRLREEMQEAQSLAMSLAEALEHISVHSPGCTHGWADATRHMAKIALSDERLTKLLEMKNG